MKNRGRTLLGMLLCAAIIIGLVAGLMPAAKADGGKTIYGLGTAGIANPTNGNGGWSQVYFGSKGTPILFNVLKNGETNFTSAASPTMLLDCAGILSDTHKKFDEDGNPNAGAQEANEWAYSDIREWMNGAFKSSAFTSVEISAIASSIKSGKGSGDGNGRDVLGWASLTGEKIFLLDAVEAMNPSYGFENTEGSSGTRAKKLNGGTGANYWWLRSPISEYDILSSAGFVRDDGTIQSNYVRDTRASVSPVLNVDMSSVIFSSEISSKVYKLTIADISNTTVDIQKGVTITRDSANQITVPYTRDNDSNHVSLVITNADATWNSGTGWNSDAVLHYYQTQTATGTTGSVTFTLPDDYEPNNSNWKVWLLAEQVNEGNKTDYASAPLAITIPSHWHNFTYTAGNGENANTITAACVNNDCDITEGLTMTINAPETSTLTYDGKAKAATLSADYNMTVYPGTYIILYQGTGEMVYSSTDAPTDAGSYKATVTVGTATAEVGFTVKRADPAVIVPTAKTGLVCTGEAQELVEAGKAVGGMMVYAISLQNTVPAEDKYNTSIPRGTDAGTYYVWYKVTGDQCHNDTSPAVIKVAIAPKEESDPGQDQDPQIEPEEDKPKPVDDEKPADKVEAFVTRCYKLILNRAADEGGLKGWSEALKGKTAAAANIIDGFVKSEEFTNRNLSNDAKVDILYKTMLNREADADGKAGWVDALSKGYTLQNIIDGFCGSAEFTAMCKDYGIEPGSVGAAAPTDTSTPRGKIEAFVKRCYQLILNRQADDGGLKGWSDALEGKTAAAAQIIDGFVRSPEYINRSLTSDQSVTILYKTMLDRDPDEAGKAGWVDALSKGYTLQHIINGFCGSAEFTKICSDYGIEAGSVAVPTQSAAALEAAAQLEAKKLPDERIGNAVSADDAGITVVNGYEPAEVEAFVKHAYRAALGREADEAGLAGWTEQIVSGAAAPKAFLRTLLGSDEFAARNLSSEALVETLYRLYLNRSMDDAAADRVAQLAAGGLDEVIKGFEGSAEFRLVLNGFGL